MDIFNSKCLKLDLKDKRYQVPKNIIGIDIGQTLTKCAYVDNDELILLLKPTTEKNDDIVNEIKISEKIFNTIHFTGGKAYNVYKEYDKEYDCSLLDEFKANICGIDFLYYLGKKNEPLDCLVVSIGTGTSIVLKRNIIQHLGGSAMGGGMFMAIVKLLYGLDDYNTIMNLANKGNRYNVDLKVSDIYAEDDSRIKDYFRTFTAASLGKITAISNIGSLKKEDVIQSLLSIIGENIGLLAILFAEIHEITEIIFCGGSLVNNTILKNLLKLMAKSRMKKPIFLKNSEFAGAVGALLS